MSEKIMLLVLFAKENPLNKNNKKRITIFRIFKSSQNHKLYSIHIYNSYIMLMVSLEFELYK